MSERFSVRAEAPSNIALIKYMGKAPSLENRPVNPSLSYALSHLITVVEIFPNDLGRDEWRALQGEGLSPILLSSDGQSRYLRHFDYLKSQLQIPGFYTVSSANNFPADSGLASSASSFAALTRAAFLLAQDCGLEPDLIEEVSDRQLSLLSQRGSGSSCRSFFYPWALWRDEGAESLRLPFEHLLHQVVILDGGRKDVSSSEAHRRVVTSELFQGRAERAKRRLSKLLEAMNAGQWTESFELIWSEFWDMHALFATSQPSFGYMTSLSMKVLETVREIWRQKGDGPWVTMDAGANVHLLYRPDQKALARWLGQELESWGHVISSPEIWEDARG